MEIRPDTNVSAAGPAHLVGHGGRHARSNSSLARLDKGLWPWTMCPLGCQTVDGWSCHPTSHNRIHDAVVPRRTGTRRQRAGRLRAWPALMTADPLRADPIPIWFLDEVDTAGRENLDPEHVARYDVKEDARAEDEVRLCRDLGLGPSSTVVEFGSGTGQFTIAAASRCRRVVAVDVSPVMLDRLRSKLAAQAIANVEVVQAGFLTYQHVGEPADLVYSRYALHHLPDFWKAVALRRIYEILRPGGVFRLWDIVFNFDPSKVEERIESWCSSGGASIEADWSRAELEEHVRDEHSTFAWLLEPMFARSGLTIDTAEFTDDGIFAKYVLRRA